MSEQTNSLCSIYATLIENEMEKKDPDPKKVKKLTGYIKKYCGLVPYPKGESPEHLKKHQIEEGSKEKGTVLYKGRKIPKSAKKLIEKGK